MPSQNPGVKMTFTIDTPFSDCYSQVIKQASDRHGLMTEAGGAHYMFNPYKVVHIWNRIESSSTLPELCYIFGR